MRKSKKSILTKVELEFMHIIWERGEANSEDMQNALAKKRRKLSDGAIRRILAILMDKGHITRRKADRYFYYKAITPKNNARKNMIRDLLIRAFDGSMSSMIAAILDAKDVKKGDIEELKRLIAEYERGEKK